MAPASNRALPGVWLLRRDGLMSSRGAAAARRVWVIVLAALVTVACSGPASDAPPEIQEQYLQAARAAGQRAGIDISDGDWLEIADLICSRQLTSQTDYEEFLDEINSGAPDRARGEVMLDVARTAISLFCPP